MKAPTETPQPGPLINQPSVVISDALAKFIGVDGTFPQEDALKYLGLHKGKPTRGMALSYLFVTFTVHF